MSVQVAEILGGVLLLLALLWLAVMVHLRPTDYDDDAPGGASWFVWAVAFVLFLAVCALFTQAGLDAFQVQ